MIKLEYASKVAREILVKYRINTPPVEVKDIIDNEGIKILFEDTSSKENTRSFSGACLYKNNKTYIIINRLNNENRQRFTLAHELGHVMLHKNLNLHVDTHSDVGAQVFFRDENSSKAIDEKEIEANRFASELLMPEEWLKNDLVKHNFIDEDIIKTLATKYKVSEQAMTIRLSRLGIIEM